ncbi:MAG: ABC transporter substrate-binding protein [Sciscionella sp.]
MALLAACLATVVTVGNASARARPAAGVSTVRTFVGGGVGKANPKLAPVTIGFVTQTTGFEAFPGTKAVFDAAIKFVNNELGGIGGHPLKEVFCNTTGAPTDGTACAQKFRANKSVSAVVMGWEGTAVASYTSTMAGAKPLVITEPLGGEATAKNTYAFYGGIYAGSGFLNWAKKFHAANKVTILNTTAALDTSIDQGLVALAKKHGQTMTPCQYPANATDFLSTFASCNLNSLGAIWATPASGDICVTQAKDLQQLHISKPVEGFLYTCLNPTVKAALGDYPKWTYEQTTPLLSPAIGAQPTAVVAIMHRYRVSPSSYLNLASPETFGSAMDLVKVLKALGPKRVSVASVTKRLKAWTGSSFLGPKVKFGIAPNTAIGTTGATYYQYFGGGKFKNLGWIYAPQ